MSVQNSNSLTDTLVPHYNLQAYSLVYELEVFLREVTIRDMEAKFGPTWWKARIPDQDAKRPFTESVDYERSKRWMNVVWQHPVYYLLLTDLRKILINKGNWREVFSLRLGGMDALSQ